MATPSEAHDFWLPIGSAALAGLVLVALDSAVAHSVADQPADLTTLCVLSVTCLAALTLGLVAELMRGRWRILIPMGLAFLLGHNLSLGPRAQTMPASDYWGVITALGTGSVALIGSFVQARSKGLFRRLLFGLALLSSALFVAGAMIQRGRYEGVRLALNGLVLIGLWTFFYFKLRHFRAGLHIGLGLSALAVGGSGAYLAVTKDLPANWAISHSSAAAPLVRYARETFLPELDTTTTDDYVHQPVLGTPLGAEALRVVEQELGSNRGFLFITIDAMRADLRNRDIGGKKATPHLDRMAQDGADFERAYAPAPMTHFSVFSFLSGWYPSQSLGFRGGFDGASLITGMLRKAGVETRGCYPKGMLIAGGDEFERFDLDFEITSLHPWDDLAIDEAFSRLRPQKKGPWFSYLHIMMPHDPYDQATLEYQAGSSDFERYAAEVRQADAYVAKLLERFNAAGFSDNMWVAVAADHGEEFGEHGAYKHSTQVFEESVHVPLVIHGKGVRPAHHSMPVSLIDLAPTLHHFFGLPVGKDTVYAGHSWLPLACGFDDVARPRTVLVENPPRHLSQFNARAAIVAQDLKLIADERSRRLLLFDLKNDPGEKKDVGAARPEERDRLWAELVARRRFGGDAESIFETMKSFDQFLDEAAEKGPAGVFTYLSWMKGLALEDEAVALAYFLDHTDPLIPEKIAEKYAEASHPQLVFLRDAIARSATQPSPEQWQKMCRRFDASSTPGVILALYAIASKWHLSLPHTELFKDSESLREKLSRAQYLSRVEARPASVDLVNQGLRSSSSWNQIMALRAMTGLELSTTPVDIRGFYESAGSVELKTLALRRLSEQKDIDLQDFFLHEARQQNGLLQSIAAFGLAQQARPHPSVNVQDFSAANKNLPAALSRANPFFCSLNNRRTELPFVAYPKGTNLALFLSFPFDGKRKLRLTIGTWSTEITQTSVVPADPLVFQIPNPAGKPSLIIEVLSGKPADFLIAGAMTFARE